MTFDHFFVFLMGCALGVVVYANTEILEEMLMEYFSKRSTMTQEAYLGCYKP